MRSRSLGAALLVLLLFYAGYASVVMLRFPNSGDEYSYVLQAELFARGVLSMPAPPESLGDALVLDHVVDDAERRRGKYTPGWSLLLAPGVLLGVAWLVNPLLSVLALCLLWLLMARVATPRAAWTALLVVGLSPLFAVNAASYFSHNASFACVTLALYGLVRAADSRRLVWSSLSGFALGFALAVRPLDGAVFGLATLVCAPLLGWRHFWAIGAGAAGPLLGFLLYHEIQFGSPLTLGYVVYRETFSTLYSGEPLLPFAIDHVRHVGVHLGWLLDFVAWSVPAALVLVPLAGGAECSNATRITLRFAVALALLELASLNGIVPNLGDHYGPRFLLPLLLPLGVLAGFGFERLWGAISGWPRASLYPSLLLVVVPALGFALNEAGPIHETVLRRSALYRLVGESGLERAVVVVRYGYDRPDHWYTRNGTDYEGSVIYVRDLGRDHVLAQAFPDRDLYRYVWDAGLGQPVLEPIRRERRIAPVAPRAAPEKAAKARAATGR